MAIPKSLLLLSLSAVALSLLCCLQPPTAAAAAEFDMWAIALYRSAHVCAKVKTCCFENECCRMLPLPEYIIHSMWPVYSNFSWPTCCSSVKMDRSQVVSLIPELVEFWPTVECSPAHHLTLCDGSGSILWEHEWEFHGTCASPIPNNQYSYFSKGIELYHKYDVGKVLRSAGFVGSNTLKYRREDIFTTIEKFVGAPPIMECEHGSLLQFRLCFEKDFTPRSCGTVLDNPCPEYISIRPSGHGGEGRNYAI